MRGEWMESEETLDGCVPVSALVAFFLYNDLSRLLLLSSLLFSPLSPQNHPFSCYTPIFSTIHRIASHRILALATIPSRFPSSASSCFLFLFSRRFFLPSSFQFHHGYRPQYLIPITVYSCIGGMHRLSIWFSFLCSVCDVRRRGSDVGWMD